MIRLNVKERIKISCSNLRIRINKSMLELSTFFHTSTDLVTFWDIYNNGVSEISNTSSSVVGCPGSGEAQCRAGHERCFPRASTCTYDTRAVDEAKHVWVQDSCRDGAHVRNYCGELCFYDVEPVCKKERDISTR